eukprot:s1448_g4.t1
MNKASKRASVLRSHGSEPQQPEPPAVVSTSLSHSFMLAQETNTAVVESILAHIAAGNLVIFNFDDMTYLGIPHSDDQTVQSLIDASHHMRFRCQHVLDILGNPLPPSTRLAEHKLVAVGTHPQRVAVELQIRTHELHRLPRREAVLFQQQAVATDEMQFYLQGLSQFQVRSVPPLVITDLGDASTLAAAWYMEAHGVSRITVSAIWLNFHWIPIIFSHADKLPLFITTTEGAHLMPLLFPATVQGEFQVCVQGSISSTTAHDCGFQALGWILAQLRQDQVTSSPVSQARAWRFAFWQHVLSSATICPEAPWLLGGQSELETAVAAILKEHGVFSNRVMDRAKYVIQQLGATPITNALRSTRPWVAIKELANQQSPKLRLIQEDEFNQVVQSRTKKEQQFSTKKKPGLKRNAPSAVFTATDIVIPGWVFCQQDGTPLAQLQLRQINPTAKGIVVASEADVKPYMTQQQISKDSLAFLVLSPFSDELAQQGHTLRFPAQSVATGEPVLLTGVILQKGAVPVVRLSPQTPMQVDTVATQTIKLLIYRDQASTAWDDVQDRPVKYILDHFPMMRICKKPNCHCTSWHAETSEGTEPILDIWQRDFLSLHFKKTRATDAAIFTVMMRVTYPTFQVLSEQSGSHGIYIEARSPDGRAQDELYHTVWLQKSSIEAARALQATADTATSLVRVTNRYGLRVSTAQAKALHDMVRPEVPFLGGTSRSTWVIGPVPFGTTRKGLVKLFQSWSWNAKPLQSIGPSADRTGLHWQVVADSPPSNFVYTLSHGDVLIVKSDAQESKAIAAGQVEASPNTCQAVANQALMQDPWAKPAANLPSAAAPALSSSQMASLEASLEQKLMKKIQNGDHDMDMQPDMEPRLAALEAQVSQIQQGQQTIAVKHQALETRVEQFGQQLEGQTKKLQNHLEDKMAEQIQRIEALFSKRARQE